MFAVPRGDIASSFAVHRTHSCSKSCLENAFCKPKSSSKSIQTWSALKQLGRWSRSAQWPSWASATLRLAAIFITLIPLASQEAP